MTKEPTREQLANELQLIRGQVAQIKRQIQDLGYQTARVGKQLLELSPQAPKPTIKV